MICNIGQLFHTRFEQHCGYIVSALVLEDEQTVLIDSTCVKLQTGLL